MYWPWSKLRLSILLLLTEGPMTPKEIAQTLGVDYNTVKKALSYMHSHGALRRHNRGVYSLHEDYLKRVNLLNNLFKNKKSDKRHHVLPSVTFLTSKEIIETIKRYVKEKYRNINEVDLAVVETLARIAAESESPYIQDLTGRGLVRVLLERAGSSSITKYAEEEIVDSIKRLAELGVIYINWKHRKLRLDRSFDIILRSV